MLVNIINDINIIIRRKFSYKIDLLNKINITTYFKNLIVELHVLYALNTHVKFFYELNIIYYMIYKLIFYT